MSSYLFAILGYFLNAAVSITDKFLVGRRQIVNPLVYSFYVGILSIFAFALSPFGLHWPGLSQLLIALIAGVFFLISLLSLFHALNINEASRIFTMIGGLTPILVFILSFFFLGERLNLSQISAFFFLVAGGVLISLKGEDKYRKFIGGTVFIFLAILAGALSLVLMKYVYLRQNFISGFIWTRLGSFILALMFLIPGKWRKSILQAGSQTKGGLGLLLISNKALAGIAAFMISFAISLGSVSIINAMQGVQYAFLLILAIILSRKFPQILAERISGWILLQKILAILLIGGGLVILAL